MRKTIHIISLYLILLLMAGGVTAQDHSAGWHLSIGSGFMNYYGDVSPYRIQQWSDWQDIFKFFQYNRNYVFEPSFGLSLEKRLTPGTGILIQANEGVFGMSDRYRKPDGTYDRYAPHWDRALNFKTRVADAGAAMIFHADNGRFLYRNAFLSPYFFIGAGMTYFQVKGDLYDNNGVPYDYADPGVYPQGNYRINLRSLMSETSKEYPNVIPYADLGIGIQLRFSKVISLTIQSDIKYSFSDYLDNVSGKYKTHYATAEEALAAHPGTNIASPGGNRGYDDGVNDFYIFNKASLQFSLGGHRRRDHFRAPVVYRPGVLLSSQTLSHTDRLSPAQEDSSKEVLQADSLPQVITGHATLDSIRNSLNQLRAVMQSLQFAHIDQKYIILQNETHYRITALEEGKKQLEDKPSLSSDDLSQIEDDQAQIDSLKIREQAIRAARVQLRKDMAHTPIITEYDDSTKIMIYKGRQSPSEGYLPVVGLPALSKDTIHVSYSEKMSDDSSLVLSSRLQEIRDSQQLAYLKQSLALLQQHDSFPPAILSSADSLQRASDTLWYRPAASGSLSPYNSNLAQIRKDSLRKNELQQAVDSLKNEQDMLRYQDSTARLARNKNFMQQLLGKFKKDEPSDHNTSQDELLLQEQIKQHQAEMERLNEEIRTLKKNNQRDVPKVSRAERRQQLLEERYLEEAIASLRSQRRRSRVEISPGVAPVIVSGNKKEYHDLERQLEGIRRRLDSLQAKQARPAGFKNLESEANDRIPSMPPSNPAADSFLYAMDSLHAVNSGEQLSEKNHRLRALNQLVDSLKGQISQVEQQQAATNKKQVNQLMAHFPVISVYFATGSSSLSATQVDKLEPVATIARHYPAVHLLLRGYTDGTGAININRIIARKRCEAVKDMLTHKFLIHPSRIQVEAIGQTGTSHRSNPMDRRVDIRLK